MNSLTRRLSSMLERWLPDRWTSLSYAIADGEELLAAGALGDQGGPEKRPATLDCCYNVASISKVYCAAAVMQLAGRGLLDLDRPIVQYLPKFTMADPRYRQITLRHCLSHSSGLPGTQWRGFSVTSLEGADYYSDVYDYLSKSTLKADPGSYSVYCNDGFTLAEMVLAQVTGQDYGDYVTQHIAEPLGAHSTRFSSNLNPSCPLIREGQKPAELLLIRGGAGVTTSMVDLVKFGQVFLTPSPVLDPDLAAEMARPQGRTFLRNDHKSPRYGLGWDNVALTDSEYDLGRGALYKGGNSFQFSTAFLVLPEFRITAALSETHDCGLAPALTLYRLVSEALAERGTFIRRSSPIPEELKALEGLYFTPGSAIEFRCGLASADLTWTFADGSHQALQENLRWDGQNLQDPSGQTAYSFETAQGEIFLIQRLRGLESPMAQRARDFPKNQAWEAREGKIYLVCDAGAQDLVIGENMTAFQVSVQKGCQGVYCLSFVQREDSGVYSHFDARVRALDDQRGQGFLRTPANPSRDLLDPRFFVQEGQEYCFAASYCYRSAQGLEAYEGQPFPQERRKNGLYRLEGPLKELPSIPQGHRLLLLREDLKPHFDSLRQRPEDFSPLEKGFVILI